VTVASPGGLWLSLIDWNACAMHGCATLGAWYSGDGGRTWEQTDLPAVRAQGCGGLGFNMPAIAKSGGGPVYAIAGGGTAACPPAPSILSRWHGSGWQVVHSWGPATVSGISWPSARHGYVVINGALARSLDAGKKWSQVWPPVAPVGPLVAESATVAMAGADATDPGVVLGSEDGGASWSALADLPGTITDMEFLNPLDGFVVLNDPVRGTWQLAATTDGGRRWARRGPFPLVPTLTRPGQGSQVVSGLWMASPSRGLLLTTNSGVAPATLWSTSDGGRTWSRGAAVPVAVSLGMAAFVLSGQSWSGWVEGGQPHPEVTFDGGRSWSTEPQFPVLGGVQLLGHGVVVGWSANSNFSYSLRLSTDGAAEWERRALPEAPSETSTVQLAFANADDGWWSAEGSVWTTTDSGRHWVLAITP
jgi:photosystem II stability/assembly factor-like uncharacterized protein